MLSTKKEKDPSEGLILVVDDNEINRYVADKLLTQCGYEVDLAEDGQIAVNKSADRQYDIILMDIHMPVLDGFKAAEMIRSRNKAELYEIPIVGLTCSVLERDLDEIVRSGMADYIPKPFVPEQLKRKVKDILNVRYEDSRL